jgi:hypothetical protein
MTDQEYFYLKEEFLMAQPRNKTQDLLLGRVFFKVFLLEYISWTGIGERYETIIQI